MNPFQKGITLLLLVALASCGGPAPGDAPPLFIMEQPVSGNQHFVNVSIDEVQILGSAGDPVGMGEFRLLIIGADTEGRSGGIFCPGNEPIKIRTGDTVSSPCLFTIGFDESQVGDGVFLMIIVIDEDESSLGADLSYEIIVNQLGNALGEAVAGKLIKFGLKSTPVTAVVSILTSFLGGKVKNWIEKAEIVGVQGILLSREDNWSAEKQTTVTSSDAGIRLSYTVTRSESGPSSQVAGPSSQVAGPDPTAKSNVLLIDDFNVPSLEFDTYTDENGTVETKDGVYVVRSISDLWHWGKTNSEFDNTVAEFDVTMISGPANNNAGFGVVCRLSERDDTSVDGYMLAISGDGYYTIRSVTASNMSPLVDWSYSDAVNQSNVLNHVRATCSGSELKLEVNGQLVASASTIADGATFGALAFSAISFEDAEKITEIHFDNLVVSQP